MLRYLQHHVAYAGTDSRPGHHMAYVHSRLAGNLQKLAAKEVVTYAAHHGDLCAQPGALQGLIRPLAAGGGMKGFAVDRLAGGGNSLRGGDHVHYEAANN